MRYCFRSFVHFLVWLVVFLLSFKNSLFHMKVLYQICLFESMSSWSLDLTPHSLDNVFFVCLFFVVWGLNSRSIPWATLPALFCDEFFFFEIGSHKLLVRCWLWTTIPVMSASWVARIRAKVFILMKSSLPVISFRDPDFVIVFKKSLAYPRLCRFSFMLSSRTFIVFHFTFRSMIHFIVVTNARCSPTWLSVHVVSDT
jgi:hypothetical protein